MKKKAKEMKFRRRRESLTNYSKRIAMVKSGLERVVVRKSNSRITAQIVVYDEKGDRIKASVDSRELAKLGWPSRCNKPTAYLTGMLLAEKADKKSEYILDIGLSTPVSGSIPFVFAKGCIDGGMRIKGALDIKEEAYNASSISRYAEALKKDQNKYTLQFGAYAREKVQPEGLQKLFTEVKAKIGKE